ncbi:MAG: hypothetical protein WC201_03785 [Bacilli bacterium]|jgi:hypothetical protein
MRYAIVTPQGSTYAPDGSCIENVQVLAFIEASDSNEALSVFEKEFLPDLQEKGFNEYSCFPKE